MKRLNNRRRAFRGGPAATRLFLTAAVLLSLLASYVDASNDASPADKSKREVIILSDYPVRIDYEKKDERVAKWVSSICGSAIPIVSGQLGLKRVSKIDILLIAKMKAFKTMSGMNLPDWGAAFAVVEKQVMLIDVQKAVSSWDALEKTIPHELSHLLLAQKVGAVPMPLWFLEGLAQWQAHQWSVTESWHLMNAVWMGKVPTLMEIMSAYPKEAGDARTAYRTSYMAFVKLFDGHPFPASIPVFLEEIKLRQDFNEALIVFRGEGLQQYSSRFANELQEKYTTHFLIFQTGPLFSILAVLFLFIVLRVKWKTRGKLKRLDRIDRGLSLDD
jgi:hypothetical protein